MKEIELQPNQIIVPGEYKLGNESILKIYFRVFDSGQGHILPPVIVARSDLISPKDRKKRLEEVIKHLEGWCKRVSFDNPFAKEKTTEKIREVKECYRRFEEKIAEAEYYLIDGNHKTAASTLTHSPIYALELQTSKDLAEVRRMAKQGELFDFKRPEKSLRKLVLAFEKYILGDKLHEDHIEHLRTVKERIDKLTSSRALPLYMRRRYLQGNDGVRK